MKINYNHWLNLDYWTFEQAAYLFNNIDPNDENLIEKISNPRYWSSSPKSAYSYPEEPICFKRFKQSLQVLEGTDLSKFDGSAKSNNKISVKVIFDIAKKKKIIINNILLKAWRNSPNNPKALSNSPATKHNPSSNEDYFGGNTIAAFNPLPISGIADLYSSVTSYDEKKWKNLASKASSNGLIDARSEVSKGKAESTFNPVLVANWLIAKKGILPARLERKLKNNLPERSKDKKEDIFGID